MLPNPCVVINKFEEYSRKGSVKVFVELGETFRAFADSDGVVDSVIDKKTLQNVVDRAVKEITIHRPSCDAWDCLIFLTSPYYTGASQVAAELPNYPHNSYNLLLQRIPIVLNDNSYGLEVWSCLKFLVHVVSRDVAQRRLVCANSAVRTSIFRYFTTHFIDSVADTKLSLLLIAANLVMIPNGDPYNCNRFGHIWLILSDGALGVISTAAMSAVHDWHGAPDVAVLRGGLAALAAMLNAVLYMRAGARARLELCREAHYRLGRNDLFRWDVELYRLLDTVADPELVDAVIYLALSYSWYVWHICGVDALLGFVTYKPPCDATAEPLLVKLKELVHETGQCSVIGRLDKLLRKYAEHSTVVAIALESMDLKDVSALASTDQPPADDSEVGSGGGSSKDKGPFTWSRLPLAYSRVSSPARPRPATLSAQPASQPPQEAVPPTVDVSTLSLAAAASIAVPVPVPVPAPRTASTSPPASSPRA